jgi:hypothetical protein
VLEFGNNRQNGEKQKFSVCTSMKRWREFDTNAKITQKRSSIIPSRLGGEYRQTTLCQRVQLKALLRSWHRACDGAALRHPTASPKHIYLNQSYAAMGIILHSVLGQNGNFSLKHLSSEAPDEADGRS